MKVVVGSFRKQIQKDELSKPHFFNVNVFVKVEGSSTFCKEVLLFRNSLVLTLSRTHSACLIYAIFYNAKTFAVFVSMLYPIQKHTPIWPASPH
jgi:hypothetical protein